MGPEKNTEPENDMNSEKNRRPEIRKECVVPLLDKRFIRVYDLQYAPGKHYFDATRRSLDDLAAVKTDEEFRRMTADAVSIFTVIAPPGEEPRLFLSYEYRYVTGQFLLSPPAGLIDPSDREAAGGEASGRGPAGAAVTAAGRAALLAAARELHEEAGLTVTDRDSLSLVSPLVFSSPGMTDESNALVLAVFRRNALAELSQDGAEGSECFDGYVLLTKDDARRVLKNGCDDNGIFYSVYTWMALTYFVTDLWKD